MMFSGQKTSYALNIFQWRRRGESSLTTGLLQDVPPEIELSDYRIPIPGSESPSGLLNGESLNSELIADLDLFFERIYSYHCEKGLLCIITTWVIELCGLGFVIGISGGLFLYVDWHRFLNANCGMDAVEAGTKPCNLWEEAFHEHPLTPMTLSKAIIIGYLVLLSICWIFCFFRLFVQLKDTLGIRHFYYNRLHITDNENKTMPWATILEKVVRLQSSEQLCVVKDLSAHDVVMRLMRKENYIIGMLNKGVLAFPVFSWLPGAGPEVKFGPDGKRYRLILTKTLEWTLNWCMLQNMFDRNFCVRREFISNPKALKKHLIVVGVAMLLLSPFLVIFLFVYLFLRHAEQFYNHPTTAFSQRWSNLSKWMFREFNEVDHLFKHRINSSVIHASEYLNQFPSPIISIIAKFISFVSGGFAAILIIIAFLEESLLEGNLFGHNLFWYAAVFGTITAISRAAVRDELLVLDPEGTMSMVVQHTHYMPKRWRGKENTENVRKEFERLFPYTAMILLEEIVSIFITPFLLIFVVPKRVDDILKFITDFTVHVEGVGHVCSLSVFDFQNHGNSNYGSPHSSSPTQRSSQGKMEKSFLNFQSSYPSWEPNAQGKHFLSNLKTFRVQKLQEQNPMHTYSPPRMWQGTTNLIGRNGIREVPRHNRGANCDLDFLGLIEGEQKRYPYLLDWYYISRPRPPHVNTHAKDDQSPPYEINIQSEADNWMPPNWTHNEARYDDYWPTTTTTHYEDREQSHMEASTSTSTPIFHESVIRHHDGTTCGKLTRSDWWNRSNPPAGGAIQASFLEPPAFNQYTSNDDDVHLDDSSEKDVEGQDQYFDWRSSRRLSRTTYLDDMDEEDGGEVHLHFDDIYSKPPETPSAESKAHNVWKV